MQQQGQIFQLALSNSSLILASIKNCEPCLLMSQNCRIAQPDSLFHIYCLYKDTLFYMAFECIYLIYTIWGFCSVSKLFKLLPVLLWPVSQVIYESRYLYLYIIKLQQKLSEGTFQIENHTEKNDDTSVHSLIPLQAGELTHLPPPLDNIWIPSPTLQKGTRT